MGFNLRPIKFRFGAHIDEKAINSHNHATFTIKSVTVSDSVLYRSSLTRVTSSLGSLLPQQHLVSLPTSALRERAKENKNKCNRSGGNIRRRISGKCRSVAFQILLFRRHSQHPVFSSLWNTIRLLLFHAYIIPYPLCVFLSVISLSLSLSASLCSLTVLVSLENSKREENSFTRLVRPLLLLFYSAFFCLFVLFWSSAKLLCL